MALRRAWRRWLAQGLPAGVRPASEIAQGEGVRCPMASSNWLSQLDEEADAGRFLDMTREHEEEYLPEGCRALGRWFAKTGTRKVLVRESFFRLQRHLLGQRPGEEARKRQPDFASRSLLLEGKAGRGKSALLEAAVAWAREHGWLAVYIPSPWEYTTNSNFSRSSKGGYDAPWAAVRMAEDAFGPALTHLDRLPRKGGEGTIGELLRAIPTGQSNEEIVDLTISTFREVKAVDQLPVLLAVDGLNALHWDSNFFEVPGGEGLRNIQTSQLRHLAPVRLLSEPPANGAFLAARSESIGVSPRAPIEDVPPGSRRRVPGLSLRETEAALANVRLGLGLDSPCPPSRAQFLQALSCGSMAELPDLDVLED